MKVRQEFVDAWIEKQAGMTELWRRSGISRKITTPDEQPPPRQGCRARRS